MLCVGRVVQVLGFAEHALDVESGVLLGSSGEGGRDVLVVAVYLLCRGVTALADLLDSVSHVLLNERLSYLK